MRIVPNFLSKRVDPADPTAGQTLDALRARQKALMANQPEAPAQIASPWQGAAYMVSSLANAVQQGRADAQEAAGRDALAQAMTKTDAQGNLSPEAQAQVMKLDPELGYKFIADSISQRRADRQRLQEQQDAVAAEGRTNAEWTRRHQLEQQDAAAAKDKWTQDPTDPTKYTNQYGEVKYVEPKERWTADAADPTKLTSSNGDIKYVKPPANWQQDAKDPTLWHDPTGSEPDRYVQAPTQFEQDPKDPTKYIDRSGRHAPTYVMPPSKYEQAPGDPTLYQDTTQQKPPTRVDPAKKFEEVPGMPGVQRDVNTGERKYPPPSVSVGADGSVTVGPGAGMKLTESQAKTTGYLARAMGAMPAIDKGEQVLTSLTPKLPELAFGDDSAIGKIGSNMLASPEYQVAKRAADEFVTAFLRGDSGATILPSEIIRYNDLFIPQVGDGPEKIAAKRRSRKIAAEAMSTSLGSTEQDVRARIETTQRKIDDPNYMPLPQVAQAGPAAPAPAAPAAPAPAAPSTPGDQFEVGKTYTDADGNKATYLGGGKWSE
jgi:hypothetical protein